MTAALRAPLGLPARLPLLFALDGQEYELAVPDTQAWVNALVLEAPGCWWGIVPAGLVPEHRDQVLARLFDEDDSFDLDDLEDLAITVVEHVLATDFWVARRLVSSAWANWLYFDAWCAGHGFSPLEHHPARLVSAAWAWRVSLVEKKEQFNALNMEIWQPSAPARASGRSRDAAPSGWTDEREAAAFESGVAALDSLRRR